LIDPEEMLVICSPYLTGGKELLTHQTVQFMTHTGDEICNDIIF